MLTTSCTYGQPEHPAKIDERTPRPKYQNGRLSELSSDLGRSKASDIFSQGIKIIIMLQPLDHLCNQEDMVAEQNTPTDALNPAATKTETIEVLPLL